jgi:hypothetical protein
MENPKNCDSQRNSFPVVLCVQLMSVIMRV